MPQHLDSLTRAFLQFINTSYIFTHEHRHEEPVATYIHNIKTRKSTMVMRVVVERVPRIVYRGKQYLRQMVNTVY